MKRENSSDLRLWSRVFGAFSTKMAKNKENKGEKKPSEHSEWDL